MKTHLYIIRHAISPFSLENERTRGLSEQGKTDAEKHHDNHNELF
jgi:2,3-bisphosphoglycerate-dependent phosphoglycerate mutase